LATTLGETSASQQATSAEPTESSVPPNRMPAPHSPDVGDGRSAAGLEYGSGDAEVEPIDLLKVTGAQTMLRRYGPMVAAAGALMVVTWLVSRRRRAALTPTEPGGFSSVTAPENPPGSSTTPSAAPIGAGAASSPGWLFSL